MGKKKKKKKGWAAEEKLQWDRQLGGRSTRGRVTEGALVTTRTVCVSSHGLLFSQPDGDLLPNN